MSLRRCFNIDISDDSFYSSNGRSCHSFTRSDSRCDTRSRVREQFNAITAYIDGSNVYGSDADTAAGLRLGQAGQLRVNRAVRGESLPTRQECGLRSEHGSKPSDLAAGDARACVQPGLTSMHTLFFREHNR